MQFEWSTQAAQQNAAILQQHGWDLTRALDAEQGTILSPGSEFRDPNYLSPLCKSHKLWPKVHKWITEGITYPFIPLLDTDRHMDLQANLQRGNHKSVTGNEDLVRKVLQDEVSRGWQLIIPIEAITQIKGAIMAPLGIVHQETINEHGKPTQKSRITHDQSFNPTPNSTRSVNDRVQHQYLTPCNYGMALPRYIKFIVQLQIQHQKIQVFLVGGFVEPCSASASAWMFATGGFSSIVAGALVALQAVTWWSGLQMPGASERVVHHHGPMEPTTCQCECISFAPPSLEYPHGMQPSPGFFSFHVSVWVVCGLVSCLILSLSIIRCCLLFILRTQTQSV